jgi:hypothetical protein
MRFALTCLLLLCASPWTSAGVVPLGGDPIGPESSTTDGQGAVSAARTGSEEQFLGQPGVAFSLDGTQRLITLRSIVTFMNRSGGRLHVPNHLFRARLWNRDDYLAARPFLQEIELGAPEGVDFQTLPDGSVVPAQSFGAAQGNIPPELPSYDFRWDLSSHSALASPLPAGNYVLALYSLSDAAADGELLVGITHEPTGLLPVFASNDPCEIEPGYWHSACCPASHQKWAIALYIQEEECCPGQSSLWGSDHNFGGIDDFGTFTSMLLGPSGGLSGGSPGGGGGGFPMSSSGGPMQSFFSADSSIFTPVHFPGDDPLMFDPHPEINFSSGDSSHGSGGGDLPAHASPVPEPSSFVLLALGALILAAVHQRRG